MPRGTVSGIPAATRARLLERSVRRNGRNEEFEGREEEVVRYLERSSGRFAATLALLDRLELRSGTRAVELGADPWLLTQLLADREIELVSAGQRRGVWTEDEAEQTPQRVVLAWAGRRVELEHHLFNVERDRWPFADGAFGLVLCCEVLEHLVYSPAHLLYEAGRVLEDDGLLLLTTPNALAATKLARLARGRNVHGPYSGYGSHGRHNRETTPAELTQLLESAGFDADVVALNLEGYEVDEPLGRGLRLLAGRVWPSRRDHLFATARRRRPPRLEFPSGLYRSVDRRRMRDEGVLLPDE